MRGFDDRCGMREVPMALLGGSLGRSVRVFQRVEGSAGGSVAVMLWLSCDLLG